MIDGELLALDQNGVAHFQLMQNALQDAKFYCAFDLMFHDGEDLRGFTLLERKKRLKEMLARINSLRSAVFEELERKGLESIVAKRADKKFLFGARMDHWLRVKTEAAVGSGHSRLSGARRKRPRFARLPLPCAKKWVAVRAAWQAHEAESREIFVCVKG